MVQMTIAQDWAACLCGLGCLSRAAGCVGRVGAGLRRRLSSGLVETRIVFAHHNSHKNLTKLSKKLLVFFNPTLPHLGGIQ